MSNNGRYINKPFLRLLEFYVLWAINCLPKEQELLLVAMTPKLQKTYRSSGEWYEIVSQQMAFSADFKDKILDVWENNKELAASRCCDLTAEEFAVNFVDVNFPH